MKISKIFLYYIMTTAICVAMTSACSEATSPTSLRGYNHMKDLSIHIFSVNGVSGPNIRPESGGGETCCVTLPKAWRPGLKANVSWEYDQKENASHPLPANKTMEIEIPHYRSAGSLQVHFYNGHKVRMIVSPCSPEHPFYPLSAAELAPWQPFTTKEDMRETARHGGGTVDC
ncbi:DUF3304 domain-containing protein [Massilia sp. Dwa41.01b]|uniref:DUF3304 domain-containing protein n=1 Tax=unclassified Massilia TaxID=2609279 RepID=UPI0016018843|nr:MULTISPECIES: DUF3304 domain-containing protein [unclassified Massilia]QNA90179.1 DUF3304 domain-containing protein [Massilia sp. Dwa41.01b]QNB01071.1 DUF3304 domain-containing protein [Massilia sp. Se16.2.3]